MMDTLIEGKINKLQDPTWQDKMLDNRGYEKTGKDRSDREKTIDKLNEKYQ